MATACFVATQPTLAQAQTCAALRAQYANVDAHGRALTSANPGITLVAAGCIATAANEYNKTRDETDAAGTFAVCGALGCSLVTGGYGNCLSVGSDIIVSALRIKALESQMRDADCL